MKYRQRGVDGWRRKKDDVVLFFSVVLLLCDRVVFEQQWHQTHYLYSHLTSYKIPPPPLFLQKKKRKTMTTTTPKVFLLLPPQEATDVSSAEAVASELSRRFGIVDVTIRSGQVPMDRLLSLMTPNKPDDNSSSSIVWVCFVNDEVSNPTSIMLQEESPFPVLNVSVTMTSPKEIALQIAKICSIGSVQISQKVWKVMIEKRQSRLVQDSQYQTKSPNYQQAIEISYDNQLQITGDTITGELLKDQKRGKVRDRFTIHEKCLALVTTDRQSGFDRQLALVPYKGAVLNMTSAFWFEQTKHIIPNHLLSIPHPNVSLVKLCEPFSIEFVVRSYMTGSTSTSIWKNYQDGVRVYCGHTLPDGMKKNQKLVTNLLTPTTKEEDHDRPISVEDIVKECWMNQQDLDVCSNAALKVFELGQQIAFDHGLILVDTKYEFGKDPNTGEILLIDEVHTPDSSRYWLASSYEERIGQGLEPENIDKEFLRLWFRDQCDPYKDKILPEAPRDLVLELSRRYVQLYEMITWKQFDFTAGGGEVTIANAIQAHMKK